MGASILKDPSDTIRAQPSRIPWAIAMPPSSAYKTESSKIHGSAIEAFTADSSVEKGLLDCSLVLQDQII